VNGIKRSILKALDLSMAPFMLPSSVLMRVLRRAGVERMPLCRRALDIAGVFPISSHYYEPLIDFDQLHQELDQPRPLPGIDLNEDGQLSLLEQFNSGEELQELMSEGPEEVGGLRVYRPGNGFFDSGDAEFWYGIIRHRKPRRIVEIGSGFSTLAAVAAVRRNRQEDSTFECDHVCVEPYERPWLERSGVRVLRERVETVDRAVFDSLQEGDLLFIDSSHVIRPQGDVLCEYLELLPRLNPGVIVHIHDIFTPRDYLKEWVVDKVRFWNEQYLLEAFLSGNSSWKIVAALNFLRHDHYSELQRAVPTLDQRSTPTSFYIQKVA